MRHSLKSRAILCLALILSLNVDAQLASAPVGEDGILRVGVYHNPPKLMLGADGEVSGIFGDLLIEIAEREGWTLEPFPCLWRECLAALSDDRIDLLPDLAKTPARAERYIFHQVPALLSWSQLYTRPQGAFPTRLTDLDGLTVAVLNGSVQHDYLLRVRAEEGVAFRLNVVESMEAGFRAVLAGEADAVATNQFFGDYRAQSIDVVPAPVMFLPSQLYFAASQPRNRAALEVIDGYLQRWRQDSDSPYFGILERWKPAARITQIPDWLMWSVAALSLALALALGLGALLRRRVADQSRRLWESEKRLASILDSVDACVYIKGKDLRYQYANRKACDWLGISPEAIVGCRDEDLFDPATCRHLRGNDQRVLLRGERVAGEEFAQPGPGMERRAFLSVKLPLRGPDEEIYALCGISTDITEHRNIQEQLHQLAYFDPLTGLPNRRMVLERVRHAQSSSARTGFDGALVLLDVDQFKTVNEAYGHQAGDQLLCELTRRLQGQLRAVDTLGRLGADEFVILLEDLDRRPGRALTLIRHMAECWLALLSEPFELDGTAYVISVSLGAALFSSAEGNTDTLLKGSALALQASKAAGRNQLNFFDPSMQLAVDRRTRLESALRRAIEAGELSLHLQPQVNRDRQVFAMEALARWHDPEFGTVSPGEFIPLAEQTGLIVPLGRWVLDKACEYLQQWQRSEALAPISLAVNISPAQFRHPEFVQHLEANFLRFDFDPALLELEITESLLIDALDQTVERMERLRRRGVKFALDDFGTGYASLSYLKRLPLHLLKIDQSFVRDLLSDPNDEAIVRTIVALADSLELTVLAEGVETEAQAQRLETLGCTLYQGYLFGRPAPMEQWRSDQRLVASG